MGISKCLVWDYGLWQFNGRNKLLPGYGLSLRSNRKAHGNGPCKNDKGIFRSFRLELQKRNTSENLHLFRRLLLPEAFEQKGCVTMWGEEKQPSTADYFGLNIIENTCRPGVLTIYTENLENQMVQTIPCGTFQKLWAIGLINALFLSFMSFPTDPSTFCDLSNLQHWILSLKISTQVDHVNGKHPRSLCSLEISAGD